MKRKLGMIFVLFFVIPGLMFTASCAKKQILKPGTEIGSGTDDIQTQGSTQAERVRRNEVERQKVLEEKRRQEREQAREQQTRAESERQSFEVAAFKNEKVYFAYNRSALSYTAREILDRKAEWMRNHPNVSVVIEGHCDDRGTNEYNLALGEKRADTVKTYLMRIGIPGGRLTTVSYGEERPSVYGQDESSRAKNRRAEFVTE
ncbi:MAG: peptidoglycan-associated lipoprotein Pal [Desulfobacterales bacterium]|nr:peptidoglycan-associated lipoprotein Pal [Desulfobacterales bacterium]